jgi:hypothetical protein
VHVPAVEGVYIDVPFSIAINCHYLNRIFLSRSYFPEKPDSLLLNILLHFVFRHLLAREKPAKRKFKMGILTWIIMGLIVGLAKWIMPARIGGFS